MRKIRLALLFLYNQYKISPQHYYTENLGIQYLGAVLRKAGFNVKIINADYESLHKKQIVNLIYEHKSDILGISPCYITMASALDIAREIKKNNPNIYVCLGGHHATFCCDSILNNEDIIDFIIRGEGEITILELAEVIESNYNQKLPIDVLSTIKGLSFQLNKEIIHNEARELIENLDMIPFPVRDPLDKVLEIGEHAMPLLCTSRGCPAYCSFCSTPLFYGRTWRARSAENVVDEIQLIVEKYGYTQFYITDDQFAGKGKNGKDHIQGIIQEIKERGLNEDYDLHFFIMVRANFFCKKNEDLIKEFPSVGFRDIFIGFESIDSNQLKIYTKGSTQKQYQEAIKILRKYDVFIEGGFIIFNPYTNFLSLRKDADFIRSLEVPLFGYYTKELMVYPGTGIYDKLMQERILIHHSYKKIQFEYKDYRINNLHEYLFNFFQSIEEIDNLLFEVIDFQIKLKARIRKIKNRRQYEETISFVKTSDNIFKKICDLNYRFFYNILDIFEMNKDLNKCQSLERRFIYEHRKLLSPIVKDYLYLNKKLNIIKSK